MTTGALLLAGAAVLVGAVVQGTIGFGLALLAAPVLALVDPRLVPAALALVVGVLNLLAVLRERAQTDWSGLRWLLVGRVPGTVVGAAVLTSLPPRAVSLGVALVVLVAVGLSAGRWRVDITPRSQVAAGFLSGVGGTATAIAGPPVALLYQHRPGAELRGTLAGFFLVGSLLTVAALVVAGELGRQDVVRAALLLPFLAVGFAVSQPLRGHVDARGLRAVVLVVAAGAALALAARSVL